MLLIKALKVHTWTATEVFLIFLNPLFSENFIHKWHSSAPFLYEMVLRCNSEPENSENIVWIAEFYPVYKHRLHKRSNSLMNNNLQ